MTALARDGAGFNECATAVASDGKTIVTGARPPPQHGL